MSLTTYDGRNLPSVFSDIPSRNEVQEARRRIGRMGMWIFLLVGAVLLAIAVAVAALYFYNQQRNDIVVLQEANGRLQADSAAYSGVTGLRDQVLTERRALLDILEGRGRNLTQEQINRGWRAARNTCAGPPNALRCFRAEQNASRATNEPSQTWTWLLDQTTTVLQYELDFVKEAKRTARTAQLSVGGPALPPPICDPVTGVCRRP
ncbi:MAG: hypothetical protein ACT4OF_13250 [Caulobacteraceae bacterium]